MLFKYYLNELQVIIYIVLLYFNFAVSDIVLTRTTGRWWISGNFHCSGICHDV